MAVITGAVASFNTFMPAKLNSVVADITPVQDLHGQSAPYPAGGGKNKFGPNTNPTLSSYLGNIGQVISGSGWTISDYIEVLPETQYTFNPNSTEGNSAKINFLDADRGFLGYINSGPKTFVTPQNCYFMRFSYRESSTNIQLELGSSATTYAPYSNICPISGWTGAKVSRTGKNLFDKSTAVVLNAYLSTTKIESSNTSRCVYFPVKAGLKYTVSKVLSERFAYGTMSQVAPPQVGDSLSTYTASHSSTSVTINIVAARWVVLWIYASNVDTLSLNTILDSIQVEVGETASPYTPYNGTTIDVEFPALGNNLINPAHLKAGTPSSAGTFPNTKIYTENIMPFVEGHTYTLYQESFPSSGTFKRKIYYYNASGQQVSYDTFDFNEENWMFELVADGNVVGFRFEWESSDGFTSIDDLLAMKPMIAKDGVSYEPFNNTVYGGTLNLNTGVLTVTHKKVKSTSKTTGGIWSINNGVANVYFADYKSTSASDSAICSLAKGYVSSGSVPSNVFAFVTGNANKRLYFINMNLVNVSTDAEFEAWLASAQPEICYELATPKTYQLTPQEISVLLGQNNIWSDTGAITVDWELLTLEGADLTMRRRNIIANMPHLATATGAVASFNTDLAIPLKKCEFAINPVQSGSGDPSPSNVRPISGWTGIAGQRAGKNLYNPAKKTDGSFIASNGKRTSNDTCSFSEAIPVEFGDIFTFSGISGKDGENRKRILMLQDDVVPAVGSFFNTAGSPHEETVTGIGTSYTMTYKIIDPRAKYIRISFNTADTNVQLEKSSSDTAYAPYTGEQIAVAFPAQGKNLFDQSQLLQAQGWALDSNGYYYGTWRSWHMKFVGGFPKQPTFVENTRYTISLYGYINSSTSNAYIRFNYTDGTYSSLAINSMNPTRFTATSIEGKTVSYISGTFGSGVDNLLYIKDFQVEEGSTATSYEPYTNTVYGGMVDVATGVLTVTHRYAEIYKDQSNWTYYANSHGWYLTSSSPYNTMKAGSWYSDAGTMCNAYPKINTWSAGKGVRFGNNNSNIFFANVDTDYTAEQWLAHIQEIQLTVVYPIEPITYQLTPQQITALKGINNIWHDANGNTTVKYWKH